MPAYSVGFQCPVRTHSASWDRGQDGTLFRELTHASPMGTSRLVTRGAGTAAGRGPRRTAVSVIARPCISTRGYRDGTAVDYVEVLTEKSTCTRVPTLPAGSIVMRPWSIRTAMTTIARDGLRSSVTPVTGIQSAPRWPVSDGIDAARHGNKEEGGEVVARWHRGDASERELHCQRVSA